MDRYRKLDIAAFKNFDRTKAASNLGHRPEVEWLRLDALVIDTNYQREIGAAGRANVVAIANAFDWARFGAVIVAAVGQGLYAIVDGQHRATACMLLGVDRVPCLVIFADEVEQASVFADINGKVVPMTALQIHAARVAAGDAKAIALRNVCQSAGVSICRYPVMASNLEVGQTLAVGALYKLLEVHGSGTLSLALRCITQSADGNPGMVRAAFVRGLCTVLGDSPALRRDQKALVEAFDEFDFETQFERARLEARSTRISSAVAFVAVVRRYLDRALAIPA